MSEIYPLFHFLAIVILMPVLVPVGLLARHSVYRIIDRYLPRKFTLFIALLYIVTFCTCFCAGFALFYCVAIHCHLPGFHFALLNRHVHCRTLSVISYNVKV